jgi:hypothetical protein
MTYKGVVRLLVAGVLTLCLLSPVWAKASPSAQDDGNGDLGPGTRKGIADFGLRIAEWKAKAQAKVRLAASRRRPRVLGLPRAT